MKNTNFKTNLAPIILIVYNRPLHTKKTIKALKRNDLAQDSDLIIFSDAAKTVDQIENVKAVRNVIRNVNEFKSIKIVERKQNYGLARNIIDAVSKTLLTNKKVIVLEDDILTTPGFLTYMNTYLTFHENDKKVGCIHGYTYPIKTITNDYFLPGSDCWGWGTWQRAWKYFEEDGVALRNYAIENNLFKDNFILKTGLMAMLNDQIEKKNDSWAVRWYFSCVKHGLLCRYPARSFVMNIGNDGSGVHSTPTSKYNGELCEKFIFQDIPIEPNAKYARKIIRFHQKRWSIFHPIFRIFKVLKLLRIK